MASQPQANPTSQGYLANKKYAPTANDFVKRIQRDVKREVTDQLYDGELDLEKMKLNRLG
jgi:hypothetical protein